MGLRFVIGRAGTGKSRHCIERIADAMRADPMGPPIFLLLPRQATFQAERELSAEVGAFCRTRIVSFDTLARDILADCGGCAVPEVTLLGRQMILGHLLRQNRSKLDYFSAVAHRAGLIGELDQAFAELERGGKSTADLDALLDELAQSDSTEYEHRSLHSKLRDLRLLYDSYTKFLGQEPLDPHRRLTQVTQRLSECSLFKNASVYVDGFLDFTEYERRLIAGLAKVAADVEVTMLLDPKSPVLANPNHLPSELSLFHRTETTFRKLWFTLRQEEIVPDEPVILEKSRRFANAHLAQLEDQMFQNISKPFDVMHGSDGIRLIEAPDRRAEVDAAARHVQELLRVNGMRLREIAVLARDLDEYQELVHASFREHDIPHFVDRRRTAAHHPLVQFVRCAVQIAQQSWPHAPLMAMVKSGLAGLTDDQADELENYVLTHRIRSSAWTSTQPWQYRTDLLTPEEAEEPAAKENLERIDASRRAIVGHLQPFVERVRGGGKSHSVRTIVTALFELLESFDIRATIAGWMESAAAEGQLEQAGEHEQVWIEMIDLFDQMVELLGDEPVSLADFQEVLESGLEGFDLALTPPTVDQVLVGQIDRTRTAGDARAVILLGMSEGQFPRSAREDSILSDSERRVLRESNIEIDPDSRRVLLNETLLGYLAFTQSGESICLTRSIADSSGRPVAPSSFWRRLQQLLPDAITESIPRDSADDLQHIGTPRQLVTSILQWARQGGERDDPRWGMYHWLVKHPCCDDPIDQMRYRAWPALTYSSEATLSPSIARQLFRLPLHASVSRIEAYAACPQQHFLRYGLKLEAREDQDITAMDLGNAYHSILESIVREMLRQKHDWHDLDTAKSQDLIRRFAQQIGEQLRGELMLSTARNRYILQRIEKNLAHVVANQRALRRRGRFRPLAAEVVFGAGDNPRLPAFEIVTPQGNKMLLHGKIDRIDVVENENLAMVIDYKLAGSSLSLERVFHGISLQLLTYLLVLQASGHKLAGRPLTPAAGFYVKLLSDLESVAHPDEAGDPADEDFHLKTHPRGIFNSDNALDLDTEMQDGHSAVIHTYRKKDGELGTKSDHATEEQFRALLEFVRRRIGELGDEIISGRIAVNPYRLGDASPCAHCDFRSVCRFDPSIDDYHKLEKLKRDDVLQQILGESDGQ